MKRTINLLFSWLFGWLAGRTVQLLAATLLGYMALLTLLRVVFYFWFSGVGDGAAPPGSDIWQAFYIGFKFDLRLAILICLPLLALCIIPYLNLFRMGWVRGISELYLALVTVALLLFYTFDFGHYAYLGLRINSGILRFTEDREAGAMVWQSYPVIRVVLAIGATAVGMVALNHRLHGFFTARAAPAIPWPAKLVGGAVTCVALLLGLLGRYADINPHNPIPLRWDAAHSVTRDAALAATALNPVLYFFETFQYGERDDDLDAAMRYYDRVADYLGVDDKDATTLSLTRTVAAPSPATAPPNVVFIMLESLGASRLSTFGLPFESTPTLDAAAQQGIFFPNFYVPVSGTARTVWASLTGIPDTTTHNTATRHPQFTHQRMIINDFTRHRKLYMIGGNASWANMRALLEKSIDGLTLYQEDFWQSPVTDVWGISDLALFRESDALLRDLHATSQPFFAVIQTAGNHRPFTIPEQRGSFQVKQMPEEALHRHGFKSNAQFNAVRFLDYALGEFFALAKAGGYFDNTVFVMYGDHNNRITTTPHMAPFIEQLGLDGLHVPGIIYAPRLLAPRVVTHPVSLLDMMPTVAGLLGVPYTNTTFGRDVFDLRHTRDRYVFTQTGASADPVIGMVGERFMLRKRAQQEAAQLHDLTADDPTRDISADHPGQFRHLKALTQGIYEISHHQMHRNRADLPPTPE